MFNESQKKIMKYVVAIVLIVSVGAVGYSAYNKQWKPFGLSLSFSNSRASNDFPDLSFKTATTNLSPNQEFSVEVIIDTKSKTISATELQIDYPSDKLEAIAITNGTFLPRELVAGSISNGRASIVLGCDPENPKNGIGTLAVIKFKSIGNFSDAEIKFNGKTKVAVIGQATNAIGSMRSVVLATIQNSPSISPTTEPTVSSTPKPELRADVACDEIYNASFKSILKGPTTRGQFGYSAVNFKGGQVIWFAGDVGHVDSYTCNNGEIFMNGVSGSFRARYDTGTKILELAGSEYVFVQAHGPITVPPPDIITSTDGNVTVGVSRLYGGAIVYYKDKRIPDSSVANGNIIDYSNGGTLLSTAIWLQPENIKERQLCWDKQKTNGNCGGGTIKYNNPTQGGYLADGHAGNPNPTTVRVENNKIYVSYRAVNYNYNYAEPAKPMTGENEAEWQTDFWGDVIISFHPLLKDVLIVDTKITYCKDLDSRCKNSTIATQDNQLSTLFSAGQQHPDAKYRGPYSRAFYYDTDQKKLVYLNNPMSNIIPKENWAGLLHSNANLGVGFSVQNYVPRNAGYSFGGWPSLSAIQPDLSKFSNSGITNDTNSFRRFSPGGWYEFKTFFATGSDDKIRSDLLTVQDPNFQETDNITVNKSVDGHVDNYSCSAIQGWTRNVSNLSERVGVRIELAESLRGKKIAEKIGTANNIRSGLESTCTGGGCSFGINISDIVSSLPDDLRDKKLYVRVYGVSNTGQNLIDYSSSPIGPCLAPRIDSFTSLNDVYTVGGYDLNWSYIKNSTSVLTVNGNIIYIASESRGFLVKPSVQTTYTLRIRNNIGYDEKSITLNPKFAGYRIGDRVRLNKSVRIKTDTLQNWWSTAQQNANTLGTVVSNAQKDLFNWDTMGQWFYKVDFDSGPDGWVNEEDLKTKITINAKGTSVQGVYPEMVLKDGNTVLGRWFVDGDYKDYSYTNINELNNNVVVNFVNDLYNGVEDRNLFVDYIIVNGIKYESEGSTTYANGVYLNGSGCTNGFLKAEKLYCNNSYFEYPTKHIIVPATVPVVPVSLKDVFGNLFSNITSVLKGGVVK